MLHHKILITGANGLLGYELCKSLGRNHSVHAIVRGKANSPIKNIHYHSVDLAGDWQIESLPKNIDTVIHLAQSSKFRDFPDHVRDVFDVNVSSTALLLDYAHKVGANHFIYASSGGVYSSEGGGSADGAFKENAPIDTGRHLGYYLGSKLCGEILAQNYASLMSVSVLRFFFMYGPRQKRSMLLPRLVDNIRAGKPVQLQGSEGLFINPIHVADAVACFDKLLEASESRTINIAGPEGFSLKQIAHIIGEAVGREPVFEVIQGTPRKLLADISLMKNYLQTPKTPLYEGIKTIL